MEVSKSNMQYYDIMIHNSGNKTWMDLYSKPTYSKVYGPFHSNCPKNYIKNIPFFLAK